MAMPPCQTKKISDRSVAVIGPVKKEHVPKAGSDDAGKTAVDSDVGQVLFPAPSVLISKEISRSRCHEDGRAEHEAIHTDGKIADKKEILMHRKSFLRSVKDLDRTKINVIGRDEAVPRAIGRLGRGSGNGQRHRGRGRRYRL